MANEDMIVGLDIGTTKVCVIIGQIGEQGTLEITGVGLTPSRGLRRGVVINIDATVKAIASAMEEAEMMSGREVQNVYAGIAGGHIEGVNSRGVVAVTGKQREIDKDDIDRVIDAARAIVIPMDREVLHVIPQEYIVDGQGGIRSPQGMIGVRLEAEVHIVTGAVSSAQNIIRCVNRAGFKVNDIVLEPIAAARSVLTSDEKELGVLLVDIGGGTTDVLVYHEGVPHHTEVLALGGDHVTSDLSIMLRTPTEAAEQIKRDTACCYLPALQDPDSETIIAGVGGRPPLVVTRRDLAEIIQPRMSEMLSSVKAQIEAAEQRAGVAGGYLARLNGGVVLTGGGALMPGTAELATEVFEMPARIGYPARLGGLEPEYQSPIFATGVGLVQYGASRQGMEQLNMNASEAGFTSVWARMRKWFGEFF